MIIRFCLLPSFLLLCACGGSNPRDDEGDRQSGYSQELRPLGKSMVYQCSDYQFIARLGSGEMAVWLEDRYVVLSRVSSASGVKYQEGDTIFWSKGDEAMLELDGQRYSSCHEAPEKVPWEDARRRGVDFRAVGNEPGWYLEIQQGRQLLFVGDYGMFRVLAPDPGAQLRGEVRTYQATTDAHQLQVEIEDDPCIDTMKGDSFPSTVIVKLDGEVFAGCGRALKIPWE